MTYDFKIILTPIECAFFKKFQEESFGHEIEELKRNCLSKKDKLYSLSLIICRRGIIRLNGRTVDTDDPNMNKPVILDSNNQMTQLLGHHYHENFNHQGL